MYYLIKAKNVNNKYYNALIDSMTFVFEDVFSSEYKENRAKIEGVYEIKDSAIRTCHRKTLTCNPAER